MSRKAGLEQSTAGKGETLWTATKDRKSNWKKAKETMNEFIMSLFLFSLSFLM